MHFQKMLNTLFKRAQFYEKINEDSAKYYYNQVIQVKTESEIYGKALRKIALLNATVKNETENLDLCKQAIAIFQKINNQKEVGITYNAMANIYQIKGYFDLAIANYQKDSYF